MFRAGCYKYVFVARPRKLTKLVVRCTVTWRKKVHAKHVFGYRHWLRQRAQVHVGTGLLYSYASLRITDKVAEVVVSIYGERELRMAHVSVGEWRETIISVEQVESDGGSVMRLLLARLRYIRHI